MDKKYMMLLACVILIMFLVVYVMKMRDDKRRLEGKTIVFIRHGEKPKYGLGQLNCKGLNRSLAIPDVLIGKYGRASKVYAPNPSVQKKDKGKDYYYIRPLATIEPTAIRLGLPVDVKYGVTDVNDIANELFYDTSKLVFVPWEHVQLVKLVKTLMKKYGANSDVIPEWKETDFDSIYVINIRDNKVSFFHDHQGLDGKHADCPY